MIKFGKIRNMDSAKPLYFIYITFFSTNIFINGYKQVGKKKLPVFFITLHSFEMLSGTGKKNFDRIQELAKFIAEWAQPIIKVYNLIIIFKSFGYHFKRYEQKYHSLRAKRSAFIREFDIANVPIFAYIEKSPISFNGCKTKKLRRRKKKHMTKPRIWFLNVFK